MTTVLYLISGVFFFLCNFPSWLPVHSQSVPGGTTITTGPGQSPGSVTRDPSVPISASSYTCSASVQSEQWRFITHTGQFRTNPCLEGIFSSLVLVTLELHLLLNNKFKLLFFTFRMFHNLLFLAIYHAVTEALWPLLIGTGPVLNYLKMYFLENYIKLF